MKKPKVERFYYRGLAVRQYTYKHLFKRKRIVYEDIETGLEAHDVTLEAFYNHVYGLASHMRRHEIELLKINMIKNKQKKLGGK